MGRAQALGTVQTSSKSYVRATMIIVGTSLLQGPQHERENGGLKFDKKSKIFKNILMYVSKYLSFLKNKFSDF